MNLSERLHNQGNEEQVMTPELKLSMELRAKCEQLLDNTGKNVIDYSKVLYFITPLLPVGLITMIISGIKLRSMPSLRERETIMEIGNVPEVKILSHNTTIPSRARTITVSVPKLDDSFKDHNILKLEKGKRGQIVTMHVLNFQFYGWDPDTTNRTERRLATKEELEAYKRYIERSSPVEHK